MFKSQAHLEIATMQLYSSFEIVVVTDTMIVIQDIAIGEWVANDADNVVDALQQIIPGGIRRRQLYYRDTGMRYERIIVGPDGNFAGFKSCKSGQQSFFKQFDRYSAIWTVYGDNDGGSQGRNVRIVPGVKLTCNF